MTYDFLSLSLKMFIIKILVNRASTYVCLLTLL